MVSARNGTSGTIWRQSVPRGDRRRRSAGVADAGDGSADPGSRCKDKWAAPVAAASGSGCRAATPITAKAGVVRSPLARAAGPRPWPGFRSPGWPRAVEHDVCAARRSRRPPGWAGTSSGRGRGRGTGRRAGGAIGREEVGADVTNATWALAGRRRPGSSALMCRRPLRGSLSTSWRDHAREGARAVERLVRCCALTGGRSKAVDDDQAVAREAERRAPQIAGLAERSRRWRW